MMGPTPLQNAYKEVDPGSRIDRKMALQKAYENMLGPKFGPCYLQSSILTFLGPFCKDLHCQTQIGLCFFKHLFVGICGPTQSWTKATEAAHAYVC